MVPAQGLRGKSNGPRMRDGNPMQALLQEAMGIDSFALDGNEHFVAEPWQDRPHLVRTPE